MAGRLLDLAASIGVPVGAGTTIVLPVLQQDLADLVGVARETVSKVLSRFVAAGWITTSARRIEVRDGEALHAFAQVDGEYRRDALGSAW